MKMERVKILAIDDNHDNLISLKALIQDAFQEAITLTALNGTRGLELTASEDPDVILLDVIMPGMDGFEVCKKLKADKELRDIPIVFVTAIKGDKESRIKALECGAEGFLSKPIEEDELAAQIRAMVKIKDKRVEKARLARLVEEQTLKLKKTHIATLNLLEDLKNENEARKISDEALRENNQRLNFHINNSPMATLEWNNDFVVTRWTGQAENMFGWNQSETIGKPIMDLHLTYEEDIPVVQKTMDKLMDGSSRVVVTANRNYTKDNKIINCEWYNTVLLDPDGKMVSIFSQVLDITERTRTEAYKEMGSEVLRILSERGNLSDLLPRVLEVFKDRTGLDAVGIRLQDGDDFPYFVQDGFTKDFLLKENSLIERVADNKVCLDKEGNICLQCTCGLVITGKADLSLPYFTNGGSFWTNDLFLFLDIPSDEDPRLHPRNECIHLKYASMALIPIRDKDGYRKLHRMTISLRDG
ncbi:MAG: response regulator, partial [Pedobacter sp.]